MEPGDTVILKSCGNETMLIKTVKNAGADNPKNESEGEEERYFVLNVQTEQPNHVEAAHEGQTEEVLCWSDLCRICANVNDHLIPIFEGEGLQHELCDKIHKYLPVQISESDTLPLQLCYHCAATLLAWHELSEGCLNAERKLLEMQESLQEKHQYFSTSSDELEVSGQDATTIPNPTESISHEESTEKDDVHGEVVVSNSDRINCKLDKGNIRRGMPTKSGGKPTRRSDKYIRLVPRSFGTSVRAGTTEARPRETPSR